MAALYDLLLHKYHVDELYDALIVNRVKDLGSARCVDAKVIDGVGVDGAGWLNALCLQDVHVWDKWVIDGC